MNLSMRLILIVTLLSCSSCVTKRTTDRGTIWELNWPKHKQEVKP